MQDQKEKTILFTGGGTIGPVTPLLALYEELVKKHPEWTYQWVGTKSGPEKELIQKHNIDFFTLPEVKLDRFFSLRNFIAPFRMIFALIKANQFLKAHKPDIVITAGGYVSVPIVWMAWLKRIPAYVHQLDIRPGLANKLMAPFAKRISVTFTESLRHFPEKKTKKTGAPVRKEMFEPSTNTFTFDEKPLVFIFGGGTGAQAINDLTWSVINELTAQFNVLHLTGKGKNDISINTSSYVQKEFLSNEMAEAMNKADVVVTRGGLGTMLELAALKKSAIVIPIPNSHQEDNAWLLKETDSAIVLDQNRLSPQLFASEIASLVKNTEKQSELKKNIVQFYDQNAVQKMADIVESLVN